MLGQVTLGQVRLRVCQVRLGQVRLGQVRLGQVRLGYQIKLDWIQLNITFFKHNLGRGFSSNNILFDSIYRSNQLVELYLSQTSQLLMAVKQNFFDFYCQTNFTRRSYRSSSKMNPNFRVASTRCSTNTHQAYCIN